MEAVFVPTSRHHALLTTLWPQSRKELYELVRRYPTKNTAILGLTIECNCKAEAAELAYEVGMYMINEENINQNLLN